MVCPLQVGLTDNATDSFAKKLSFNPGRVHTHEGWYVGAAVITGGIAAYYISRSRAEMARRKPKVETSLFMAEPLTSIDTLTDNYDDMKTKMELMIMKIQAMFEVTFEVSGYVTLPLKPAIVEQLLYLPLIYHTLAVERFLEMRARNKEC
ncbi:unnamed protein product [Timema podura]|uniref:Uncharacterized protein n=1 Tax=Timema podura TaxID=61482 RepID=A0ABN7P7X1_TIMPD|nr:unnamed protein product [Timema podura]